MKKIYNKKTFWAGIIFAILSVTLIFFMASKFGDMDSSNFIKYGLFSLVSMGIGFFFINQSLKSHKKDKREQLINEKAYKASMRTVQIVSWLAMVISIVVWYISKIDVTIGMILAFGIMFNVSLFAQPLAYIYYDRKHKEEKEK